jgi:hypothetical protein
MGKITILTLFGATVLRKHWHRSRPRPCKQKRRTFSRAEPNPSGRRRPMPLPKMFSIVLARPIEVFAEEAERHEAAGSRERSDHTDTHTARVISISTLRGRRPPLLHLLPIHGAVATDRPAPHPIPRKATIPFPRPSSTRTGHLTVGLASTPPPPLQPPHSPVGFPAIT